MHLGIQKIQKTTNINLRFTSRCLISAQSRSLYFLLLIFSTVRSASYYKLALHYCSIPTTQKTKRKNVYNFLWSLITLACRHADTLWVLRWTEKLNAHLMTNLWIVTFNGSMDRWMDGKTKHEISVRNAATKTTRNLQDWTNHLLIFGEKVH